MHNQPAIRKANGYKNTSFVQSEIRTIVLHSARQQARGFLQIIKMEKMPKFALLEGTIVIVDEGAA